MIPSQHIEFQLCQRILKSSKLITSHIQGLIIFIAMVFTGRAILIACPDLFKGTIFSLEMWKGPRIVTVEGQFPYPLILTKISIRYGEKLANCDGSFLKNEGIQMLLGNDLQRQCCCLQIQFSLLVRSKKFLTFCSLPLTGISSLITKHSIYMKWD